MFFCLGSRSLRPRTNQSSISLGLLSQCLGKIQAGGDTMLESLGTLLDVEVENKTNVDYSTREVDRLHGTNKRWLLQLEPS